MNEETANRYKKILADYKCLTNRQDELEAVLYNLDKTGAYIRISAYGKSVFMGGCIEKIRDLLNEEINIVKYQIIHL